ncbi:stage III sporulation protein AA [Alkalithermobacter paradoxus]|uniref:AAA+ ATPase domain-containing protein n=1 Tax=Alkalithermobacter paradoxus TaxID=29349 RepID=A0A1V4IAH4_9FIRM|nr:hypothetical protein CLOTH_02180 [[Clostridium] thermoalcaliphilum]
MNKLPEEIVNSLSPRIKTLVHNASYDFRGEIEEIRMRVKRPLMLIGNNKEYFISDKGRVFTKFNSECYIVSSEDIEQTFQIICKHSIHSFLEDIKKGFITVRGGHRVGLGGKVLIEGDNIKNIKHISSLNIRISKQVLNCSKRVLRHIISSSNKINNTLIISPPQCGKTTLLRDIVRNISNGVDEYNFEGLKTVVIDERNEISGSYLGMPQMDIGIRTDIIESCPKDIGIMMVLRAMSPNVIVTDEIGSSKEINALYNALNGGVSLITTVHGYGMEDIQNRKEINRLLDKELFKKVIVLSNRLGPGTVEKIYDLEEKRCLFVS